MKNEEIYKTVAERMRGFKIFCGKHKCAACPCSKTGFASRECKYIWLSLEGKEEVSKNDLPFYMRKYDGMDWYTVFIKKENGDGIAIFTSDAKGNIQSFCDQLNAAALAWHERMKKEGKQ